MLDPTLEPRTSMNITNEERITALAARQHGLVTRAQLLQAGLTSRMVRVRVGSKRLRIVHRGVYLAGPAMTSRGRVLAAVLACGPDTMASHWDAASLWRLLRTPDIARPVHVTIPHRDRSQRAGIRAHRVARLDEADRATVDDIAVTAPARTLLDLATVMEGNQLERVVARAERRELVTREQLARVLERSRGRPGVVRLRALVHTHGGPALTRSEAERRFPGLVREYRLSRPEVNVLLHGYEVDFLWREEGIAVEVDGFEFHASQTQFEGDRRRDARMAAAGIQVVRVTWRRIVEEPGPLVVELAQALALASMLR